MKVASDAACQPALPRRLCAPVFVSSPGAFVRLCCSTRRYCDCFANGDFCNNCNCNNCCNNLRHEIERLKAIKVKISFKYTHVDTYMWNLEKWYR